LAAALGTRHATSHIELRHVAPVHVTGPVARNLLAVWAQNGSGGVSRKHQLGPLRRAHTKYKALLAERPTIVAGDFNNNVFWHRPGWRINHANELATLEKLGLASACAGNARARRRSQPFIGGTARRTAPGTTTTTSFCRHHGSAVCAS
jgi:endonuclease/exonuclease/phosphatase family metal-dependent hydrolase